MSAEIFRYAIGDIAVTVLSDGFRMADAAGFVSNASTEEVAAALKAASLPTDKIRNSYAPIVLETGGRRVLFDTGNGEAAFVQTNGERGRLQHNLAAAGIDRNAIDLVVISHCHADHVNGLLTPDGQRAFPNAEIKVPEVELGFWLDDGEMSRAPKGRMTELFQNNRRVFDALERRVTPYAWDSEVAPCVTALGTPGHSIGHSSFMVTSGSERVYVQSDVCNHAVLFGLHPDWQGWFDQDPEQAARTRRRVYDMLAAEAIRVQGFHYPFPALCRVEKAGEGFRVSAAA